jgi:hypothetical protein
MFVKQRENVGTEALTAVNIKNIVFWNPTPCNLAGVYQRFGGTRSSWFAACFPLLFDPEDGRSTFLRKVSTFLLDYATSHLRIQHFSIKQCFLLEQANK